jgi:hypothetical protein
LERKFALQLDAIVRNEALWESIASPPHDSNWRRDMALQALRLYALTSSMVVQRPLDSTEPIDYAAGLLRDVGDTCAILARDWPPDDQTPRPILNLAELQRSIDESELTAWANSIGITFRTASNGTELDRAQETNLDNAEDFPGDDLAESWASLMGAYRRLVDLRAQDPELRATAWSGPQDWACACVASGRTYLGWARKGFDFRALAVAGSHHLAAQGIFIATHDQNPENLVPDVALGRLLRETGGIEWLQQHGAEIPAWLPS